MPLMKQELKDMISCELKTLSSERFMPMNDLEKFIAKKYEVSNSFIRRLTITLGLREKKNRKENGFTGEESEYFRWEELKGHLMVTSSYD